MFEKFKRYRRLWRAYKGRCPYCGEKLVERHHKMTNKTPTGSIFRFFRQCPQAHFAIEYSSRNKVVIHDNFGDPIELLFHRNLRIVKNDEPTR